MLNLRNNYLGDVGAQALCDAIKQFDDCIGGSVNLQQNNNITS